MEKVAVSIKWDNPKIVSVVDRASHKIINVKQVNVARC